MGAHCGNDGVGTEEATMSAALSRGRGGTTALLLPAPAPAPMTFLWVPSPCLRHVEHNDDRVTKRSLLKHGAYIGKHGTARGTWRRSVVLAVSGEWHPSGRRLGS